MFIQLITKFDTAQDKVVKGVTVDTHKVEFAHFDYENNELAVGMVSGLVNKLPIYPEGLPMVESNNNYNTLMKWRPIRN